jgi:polyhydroxybutyrate depolymerase
MMERTNMQWRLSWLILLAIAVLYIMGCAETSSSDGNNIAQPTAGLFTDNTIVVDGLTRTYAYYVPDHLGASSPPLVFLLHGGGSSTDDLTGRSGFKAPYKVWMDIADAEELILVYPEGTKNPAGALGWNDCRADATTNPTVNDVAFIDALINQFSKRFNIDTNRIYASGTSNGGHMSLRLALELSNKIAAVAPVAAAMPKTSCSGANHPISVLFMNGTADPLLPYDGGEVAPSIGGRGAVLSAQESVDYWIDFNQTDAMPSIATFPDINTADNSTVLSHTYANGLEGTQVVFYEVENGGHVEPSVQEQYASVVESYLGKQNHDIEMAREIWNFFKHKALLGPVINPAP